KKQLKNINIDEKQLVHVEAIIQSMTKQERQDPSIMNASRKKRIAKGSGTNVSQVNRLLKQFNEMKKMMKQMTNMQKGKKGKSKGLTFQFMYIRTCFYCSFKVTLNFKNRSMFLCGGHVFSLHAVR